MPDYPDHQHQFGFSSKRYAWVSNGAFGSVSHIALTPRQSNPVTGLCGTAVAAIDIKRSVLPKHACPQCLQLYTEQAKRDLGTGDHCAC
jgi:hypothetical protein